jgi:hypothetical protein
MSEDLKYKIEGEGKRERGGLSYIKSLIKLEREDPMKRRL